MAKSKINFFKIYDNSIVKTADNPILNVTRLLQSGRDAGQFRKWFDINSGEVIYITCGVISFDTLTGDQYYLVWPFSPDVELTAHWDELKNEAIIDSTRSVKHIALYCSDKVTLLKSWTTSSAVGVSPKVIYHASSCPSGPIISCWNIPRLPLLESNEPLAPKSTELFNYCVNIPGLPLLV